MQYTKILKFRYNDLPQEFLCKICKTVCLNPRQQQTFIDQLSDYCVPSDCEQVDTFYSIEFRNQIQQFIQIQCEYCGEYQKYIHYRIHSNLCQLIFQKSQFLLYFKQTSFENHNIRCYICNQIPYRPEENNDKKLICLFCIKGGDFQNMNQLSFGEQTLIDQIVLQCSQINCQKHVKLNKALKHYKKCQMKNSELIQSDEYIQLLTSHNQQLFFKLQYKKYDIGLKYQKQQILKQVKLSYDLAKTELVKKQLRKKIANQEKIINLIHYDK